MEDLTHFAIKPHNVHHLKICVALDRILQINLRWPLKKIHFLLQWYTVV